MLVQSFWKISIKVEYTPKLQCRRPEFYPWVGKIPWRRKWQPTPVVLPRESHRQRSLAGYSQWARERPRVGHDLATKPLDHTPELWPLNSFPLMDMHTYVQQKVCTGMIIAALIIMAPNWKLSKCPSTIEWIKILTVFFWRATVWSQAGYKVSRKTLE